MGCEYPPWARVEQGRAVKGMTSATRTQMGGGWGHTVAEDAGTVLGPALNSGHESQLDRVRDTVDCSWG